MLQEILARYPEPAHEISLNEAMTLFPVVGERLSDHRTALISHATGLRLPSADERLDEAGGAEYVNALINRRPRSKNERYQLAILSSFGEPNDPLAMTEMRDYIDHLWWDKDQGVKVYSNTRKLQTQGEVSQTTHIVRFTQVGIDTVIIQPRLPGYQIAESGSGRLARAQREPIQERRRLVVPTAWIPGTVMP